MVSKRIDDIPDEWNAPTARRRGELDRPSLVVEVIAGG